MPCTNRVTTHAPARGYFARTRTTRPFGIHQKSGASECQWASYQRSVRCRKTQDNTGNGKAAPLTLSIGHYLRRRAICEAIFRVTIALYMLALQSATLYFVCLVALGITTHPVCYGGWDSSELSRFGKVFNMDRWTPPVMYMPSGQSATMYSVRSKVQRHTGAS